MINLPSAFVTSKIKHCARLQDGGNPGVANSDKEEPNAKIKKENYV